jgi:hypothetical protein
MEKLAPVIDQLLKLDNGKMKEFLKLCLRYDDNAAPLRNWKEEVKDITQDIDKIRFAEIAVIFLEKWCELMPIWHKTLPEQEHLWIYRLYIPAWVSPFIWYAGLSLSDKPGIRQALSDLADLSFKKVPGIGSLSVKTGNACIHAFALMPDNSGIIHILRQQERAVNKTVGKTIEKVLQKLASRDKLTPGALMEIGIPISGWMKMVWPPSDFGDMKLCSVLKTMPV